MEIIEIVGFKHVNFTDDSGKTICGWSIFYLMDDDRVVGKVAGKVFVSDQKAASANFNQELGKYEVWYDRYGKPSKFVAIS